MTDDYLLLTRQSLSRPKKIGPMLMREEIRKLWMPHTRELRKFALSMVTVVAQMALSIYPLISNLSCADGK
jgi:hypothetical protein